jgi:hypothetical protein
MNRFRLFHALLQSEFDSETPDLFHQKNTEPMNKEVDSYWKIITFSRNKVRLFLMDLGCVGLRSNPYSSRFRDL